VLRAQVPDRPSPTTRECEMRRRCRVSRQLISPMSSQVHHHQHAARTREERRATLSVSHATPRAVDILQCCPLSKLGSGNILTTVAAGLGGLAELPWARVGLLAARGADAVLWAREKTPVVLQVQSTPNCQLSIWTTEHGNNGRMGCKRAHTRSSEAVYDSPLIDPHPSSFYAVC
jgi:hypothetical protein